MILVEHGDVDPIDTKCLTGAYGRWNNDRFVIMAGAFRQRGQRVVKAVFDRLQGLLIAIDVQGCVHSPIDSPQIIQAIQVIRMGMREENAIQMRNIRAQKLLAEIGRGIKKIGLTSYLHE